MRAWVVCIAGGPSVTRQPYRHVRTLFFLPVQCFACVHLVHNAVVRVVEGVVGIASAHLLNTV